jgi:CHAT domain
MMPRRRHRISGASIVAPWLAVGGLALGAFGAAPGAAAAAGPCSYLLNGQSLDAAATPDQALDVAAGSDLVLSAAGPRALGQVRVDLEFWPVSVSAYRPPFATAQTWTGTIRLADQGVTQQGLYHVIVDEDLPECPPTAGWVRLAGGPPFLTLPGAIGTAAALGGIVLVLFALRRAAGVGGGLRLATLGGVAFGLGALAVAQQAGVAHADAGAATLWGGGPGFAAMGLTSVVGRRGQGRLLQRPRTASAGPSLERIEWDRALPRSTQAAARDVEPAAVQARPHAPSEAPPSPVGVTRAEPPGLAAAPPPIAAVGATAAAPEAPAAWAPPAADSLDPPRVSYARLDAPEAVVAETTFTLVVGLRPEPDVSVGAAPLVRPDWSKGSYPLTVQLLAEGFERLPPSADPWRIELTVTAKKAHPTASLRLRPLPTDRPVRIRQIRALYAVEGQALGDASRPIAVVDQVSRLGELEPLAPQPPETLSTPRGEDAPDLTIRLEHAEGEAGGKFTWQMLIRHGIDLAVSSNPLPVDLGGEAQNFLRDLVAEVADHATDGFLKPALLGAGNSVTKQVPLEFWSVFARVAAAVAPRAPTIQILSAESHVPWELAVLPDDVPLVFPDAPRYLGAQADVGRWVLGRPPPGIPPPGRVMVHSMAVISGVYPAPANLEQAAAEATALADDFGAQPVDANADAVGGCLAADPPYQVIHFAVHGRSYDAGDGAAPAAVASPRILLIGDGQLDEGVVMGIKLVDTPVVFLNACQVGIGHDVLGDYAGLAPAFLYAGAAAVIAPLWSIDDTAAREIAHRFYERVFAGASPASALRLERASFGTSPATASSTFLAYQYYGHPLLRVERAQP